MSEITRYEPADATLSRSGMMPCASGAFVLYSDVQQLQAAHAEEIAELCHKLEMATQDADADAALLRDMRAASKRLGIKWGDGDAQFLHAMVKEIEKARTELAARDQTIAELRERLLTAAGDDLCRLTQEEIKAMSAGEVKIPPKEEFLASCERFHAQVAGTAGVISNCLTLAQLIAENERLRQCYQVSLDNEAFTESQLTASQAAGEKQKIDLEKLGRYFNICEAHGGTRSYAADQILNHFNDDGSLKGEGIWRAKDIHKWVKAFVEADDLIGKELNDIDWTLPDSLVPEPTEQDLKNLATAKAQPPAAPAGE